MMQQPMNLMSTEKKVPKTGERMTAAFSGKLSTANGCTSDGKRHVTCWFVGALACAEIRVVIAHAVKWRFDRTSICVALQTSNGSVDY